MNAITLEVREFLPLGTRATAALDKAREYLNAMKAVRKTPSAITLFAGDFDFVFNAVKRQLAAKYKTTEQAPPPHRGVDVQRHSAAAWEG